MTPQSDVNDLPTGSPWRRDVRFWLGAGIVLLVVFGVLAALYLSRRGPSLAAARLPAVAPLAVAPGFLRGDVNAAGNDNISIATSGGGTMSISIGSGTRVEALVPARPSTIAVGDYLTVGGMPNLVLSFAIKLVVDIPAGEAQDTPSGPPKSKGGFSGWETYTNPAQAPEVYGRVEAIDADGYHLNGPLGPITVKIDEQSPLRRLTSGGIDLIHGGDHLALPAGSNATPAAVLVLGGGS
jgi:hypothetical protein